MKLPNPEMHKSWLLRIVSGNVKKREFYKCKRRRNVTKQRRTRLERQFTGLKLLLMAGGMSFKLA
jgi:hypothetical protein